MPGRTLACAALMLSLLAPQQAPPQPQPPRPPVFRAGAHYVRVDAYPTAKNGNIITGLTRDDFEVYEDGRLQALERAEFVTFDTWTPEGERKDPRTQQDAYDLAADPNWRVFVIVIDPAAYGMDGRHYLREPLHQFIDRNLGPRDLFGLVTTENEWTDLVLGQTTSMANAVLDSRDWFDPDRVEEKYWPYFECGLGSMVARKRLEDTYALLEGLVKLLSAIRQERKGIVFVTGGLAQPPTVNSTTAMSGIPDMPRIGSAGGHIGELSPKGDRVGGHASRASWCNSERMRLASIDFTERFRDLLKAARQGNVAFYPVSPGGLQTMPFKPEGGVDLQAWHAMMRRNDTLLTLASETDGIAIVNTNDFAGGLRRIASDMQAFYVLGYYTNNTKWDGGVRSIKVRLKPRHDVIRARKQYRAPTLEEIAALSARPSSSGSSAEQKAFGELSRPESSAVVPVEGPFLFRNGAPAARLVCSRTDRVRVEWPAAAVQTGASARLLNRSGQPLPVPVTVRDNGGTESHRVIVELSLAPLARGEYLVELSTSNSADRKLVALRIE